LTRLWLVNYYFFLFILNNKKNIYFLLYIILVQIRFLKTSYLGQQNEDGTMINPIMPFNALFLGLLGPYRQSVDSVILDSKMNA
jgi:hypothetical protein